MKIFVFIIFIILSRTSYSLTENIEFNKILFFDDFSELEVGYISAPYGPSLEYHYLANAGKRGNWNVTNYVLNRTDPSLLYHFKDDPYFSIIEKIAKKDNKRGGWGTAWLVKKENDNNIVYQTFQNTHNHERSHPMIIAGDSLWKNYKLEVLFCPENDSLSSGVAFRYKNGRQYYFFGIKNSKVYISKINHGAGFRVLNEEILVEQPFNFVSGQELKAIVMVNDNTIEASLNNEINLKIVDNTFPVGKIGLVSNAKAKYKSVKVFTSENELKNIQVKKNAYEREITKLQEANPDMILWKKIQTKGFGVGRNIRFGDLNMDGQKDVLLGQIVYSDPSQLSCLTAITFDGDVLWQIGDPDPKNYVLTSDIPFQIHDIDNDGKNEVIYSMNHDLIIADGATGKIKKKTSAPKIKNKDGLFSPIFIDCIFFFDCEGKGYDSNILIKDRYENFWVMNSLLEVIWNGSCNTAHYPYAYDIDNDSKDELAIGYSLYDDDGTQLWNLDDKIENHTDGVAIVDFDQNTFTRPDIFYSASCAGYYRVDLDGKILIHHDIGHVQNPTVANFRSDKPGLETVTINFWGNQGIIHFFDFNGNIYHDFEPNQFGSMVLPLNWTGKEEEYFVHNPSISEGGVFDGWGRKVLEFPNDGHPDMCNAVLDISGDCRDEIVVWNPNEIWVYTQSDNPKQGRLYKPVRNPLYNYSNYQATVSLPGWSDD